MPEATAALRNMVSTIRVDSSGLWLRSGTVDEGVDVAHEASPVVPLGTVFGGRYVIEEHIGTGNFATVYKARDENVAGHWVALKLLHRSSHSEESRQRVLRELHHIASVFHPSLVQYKDHGWFGERLWFVMPWYNGETLEERIRREPLTRAEALRIFQPLARALAAMHAAKIRHQDIKPDNIFLARLQGFHAATEGDDEILPVLLDLGVATRDTERALAGTPTYFSPEVAARFAELDDVAPVTAKSDVFSLALALRNSLCPTERETISGADMKLYIERRATRDLTPPKRKDLRFLAPYFRRWLSHDPSVRPTAEQFAEQLRVLTQPERRFEQRMTVLRWVVPLVLTLGALLLGTLAVLHQQRQQQLIEAERAKLAEAGLRANNEALAEDLREYRMRYERTLSTKELLSRRVRRMWQGLQTMQVEIEQHGIQHRLAQQEIMAHTQEVMKGRKRIEWLEAQLVQTEQQLSMLQQENYSLRNRTNDLREQLSDDVMRSAAEVAAISAQDLGTNSASAAEVGEAGKAGEAVAAEAQAAETASSTGEASASSAQAKDDASQGAAASSGAADKAGTAQKPTGANAAAEIKGEKAGTKGRSPEELLRLLDFEKPAPESAPAERATPQTMDAPTNLGTTTSP